MSDDISQAVACQRAWDRHKPGFSTRILLFQVCEAADCFQSSILPLSISLPFWVFISSIKNKNKEKTDSELYMQHKYLVCNSIGGMTLISIWGLFTMIILDYQSCCVKFHLSTFSTIERMSYNLFPEELTGPSKISFTQHAVSWTRLYSFRRLRGSLESLMSTLWGQPAIESSRHTLSTEASLSVLLPSSHCPLIQNNL